MEITILRKNDGKGTEQSISYVAFTNFEDFSQAQVFQAAQTFPDPFTAGEAARLRLPVIPGVDEYSVYPNIDPTQPFADQD